MFLPTSSDSRNPAVKSGFRDLVSFGALPGLSFCILGLLEAFKTILQSCVAQCYSSGPSWFIFSSFSKLKSVELGPAQENSIFHHVSVLCHIAPHCSETRNTWGPHVLSQLPCRDDPHQAGKLRRTSYYASHIALCPQTQSSETLALDSSVRAEVLHARSTTGSQWVCEHRKTVYYSLWRKSVLLSNSVRSWSFGKH